MPSTPKLIEANYSIQLNSALAVFLTRDRKANNKLPFSMKSITLLM